MTIEQKTDRDMFALTFAMACVIGLLLNGLNGLAEALLACAFVAVCMLLALMIRAMVKVMFRPTSKPVPSILPDAETCRAINERWAKINPRI